MILIGPHSCRLEQSIREFYRQERKSLCLRSCIQRRATGWRQSTPNLPPVNQQDDGQFLQDPLKQDGFHLQALRGLCGAVRLLWKLLNVLLEVLDRLCFSFQFYTNLQFTWKEEMSLEELSCSDWPVTIFVSHSLNCYLMEGPAHCVSWCLSHQQNNSN